MIVTIDTDKIKVAVDEAGEFYFKPGAEKHLKLLVTYEAEIAAAVDAAKANIQKVIDENNAAVKSIVGDKVKVTVSPTGGIYAAADIKKVEPAYVKQAVREFLNSDAVAKYQEEHDGKLPKGVAVAVRKYRMAIKVME